MKATPWFIIFFATILLFLNSTLGFACEAFRIVDRANLNMRLIEDPSFDSPFFKIEDASDFFYSLGVRITFDPHGLLILTLVVFNWRCDCSLEDLGTMEWPLAVLGTNSYLDRCIR